jgi:hypothetical protein
MRYNVDIHKRDIDPYDESGEWMDGLSRELRTYATDVNTYDDDYAEEYGSPVAWAIALIARTDATDPSVYPVPAEVPERVWLSGSYTDPHGTTETETSVYLTGDGWTPAERAEVFRACSRT